MPARVFKGMVVVVPSFSHGQNSNEGIVHGNIASLEHLSAPDMADGVDCPSDVPAEHHSQREAPNECWESAKSEVN